MNIYENERQRVNERIDKIKNRVITDSEQPISVVFIDKEPVLAEDAKEFKNLKRMLEILDNGLSQKSDWEYLELRNKTGLFSMELRYQSAFRNHDSIIAKEKELVEKSIKDILTPTFSKNKEYASDGSYIPRDELYKYEALLGMRDQLLNGFDTEDYYDYMSLREQSGLGSLSDNEYLNLMGKESPYNRPYFSFKDNKYIHNKPYVHGIEKEKITNLDKGAEKSKDMNSISGPTESEKDNVDLPKRSMDGNAHESKNSSNDFNRADFHTDMIQPKKSTSEQIRVAAPGVSLVKSAESSESDSKTDVIELDAKVIDEATARKLKANAIEAEFEVIDDGTEPKTDVAAGLKTDVAAGLNTGVATEPKTGVATEPKTDNGTEPKTGDGTNQSQNESFFSKSEGTNSSTISVDPQNAYRFEEFTGDRTEPKLDIDPDEEPHEVVKSTPWQWAKKHKKVILAVGITAVTITVAVALTQLAPAIGAYMKASQVSNIATGMVKNATSWHTAAAAEKAALHNSNIVLAKKLSEISGAGAVYEKATGVWTIGSTVLPEFAKTATSAVTQAASKILTSSFLTAIPGITGAAALGIAGKRSDEYKKINQHIKNAHGSLKQLPTDGLKNAANLIDNEITSSDKLSKHEKSILLRKYRKLLKNINKKEEQEKQQEEQHSQEQSDRTI